MVRVLLSRRVPAFTALVLVLIPAFILLGMWQWSRFEERSAATALQEANLSADPVPFERLTGVGDEVADEDRWHAVTVSGNYDTSSEFLVRNRTSERGLGYYVVTPLLTGDGTAVLVNRGWIPYGETASQRPPVPEPPTGEVTVTGRAQPDETEATTGIRPREELPPGQTMLINSSNLAADLSYPVYGGFVERVEQRPPSEDAPVPPSVPDYNYGLNLAYAVQWWAFAVIALGGWVVLVWRERRHAASATEPPLSEPATPRGAGSETR